MKHIFLDTNVLIDFLSDRKPFSLDAAKLFNHAVSHNVKIYISAISYNNIYYIMKQSLSSKETLKLLSELTELVEIIDVTKSIVKKALVSDFKDFEDVIQYYCALSHTKIEFIVTRDAKDFKKSQLSVLTPHEAIGLIENNLI